jgi:ubiquitin-like-conjugating enzyme ATG3
MRHAVHSAYKAAAEAVGVTTGKDGTLQPDDFITAGDFLVASCPTWSWESGDRSRAKPYLPPAKQYLCTRNVPCLRRASAEEAACEAACETGVEEEDWLAPARPELSVSDAAIPFLDTAVSDTAGPPKALAADAEDVPDMDSFDAGVDNLVKAMAQAARSRGDAEDDDDDATYLRAAEPNDNILRTRTYDVSITYDKYYQTPRIW